MRKLSYLIIFVIGIIACKSKLSQQQNDNSEQSKSVLEKDINDSNSSVDNHNFNINWNNYEKVYIFHDTIDNTKQTLGVNWFGSDSISYQILFQSDLGDMEIDGIAIVNHLNEDVEIDDDIDGAYPVEEYIDEGENYVISVRIDLEEKSKARFIYTHEGDIDDYEPNENFIMRTKNVR